MEDKGGLSRRRKSIMVIDKKGKAQEVLKQSKSSSKDDSKIKGENKGEESINILESTNGMGQKEKECKCEMCTLDGCKRCEMCKKMDCKECNYTDTSSASSINVSSIKEMNDSKLKDTVKDESSLISRSNKSETSMISQSNKSGSSNEPKDTNDKTPDDKTPDDKTANDKTPDDKTPDDTTDPKLEATIENHSKDMKDDVRADDPKTNLKTMAGVATTGAVVGAGPGIVLGKSADEEKKIQELKIRDHEKKVKIDESRNKEYSVPKDGDKSIPLSEEEKYDGKTGHVRSESLEQFDTAFVPPSIPAEQLPGDSEILMERDNNNVVCEGHMWKRRRIFACFWHEKYFVLTKEGILKYHKANGTKYSKGNWNLKNVNRIHEVFIGTEKHPYRLALICDTENLLFGYDDPDTREFWYNQFSKFIDF